ncbi:hypothetical protein AB0B97_12435 [Micromonospora sp. NPDC049004]|uniref:hypothetical protein n=1 Tax=Micromonospora sp. NPDC049004 TaxID=3154348 RepID=UPI0033F80FD1
MTLLPAGARLVWTWGAASARDGLRGPDRWVAGLDEAGRVLHPGWVSSMRTPQPA